MCVWFFDVTIPNAPQWLTKREVNPDALQGDILEMNVAIPSEST